MKNDKMAIVVRDKESQFEALRSALGLGLEMVHTDVFAIGEVTLPEEQHEKYKENLEFLLELEGSSGESCRLYTDTRSNVDTWGYFEYLSLDEIAGKLADYDVISPF